LKENSKINGFAIELKIIQKKKVINISGLVVFPLLAIVFSLFFFLTSSQITPAFGDQSQSNGVHQVRLYSLLRRHSIASSEIQSGLSGEQRKSPSTKLIEMPGPISIQKTRINVNDLIVSPAYDVTPQGRPVSPVYPLIHARENERDVKVRARFDMVEDFYTASNLDKTREGSMKSQSAKIPPREKPFGGVDVMEGAGGSLGDFFEGGTVSTPTKGAHKIEVTPRISVKGEYDDNITLLNKNPIADYTTTVSPGLKISADSGSNGLELDYEFGWVKYHKETRNDYIRHRGTLGLWQKIGSYLTFRLTDTYIKSNDFLADIDQFPVTQRVANTLSAYQRNDARAGLDFQFGPKNHFLVGYIYNILDNDDPSLEDAREQGPFATLSYWFTQKDGLDLSYENFRYVYDQPDYYTNWKDLDAHNMRGAYVHQFGVRTGASLYYGLSIRKSIDFPIQYEIHDVGAGFDHSFSPSTSLTLGLGYYKPTGDTSLPGTPALDPGVTSLIQFTKGFRRGSVSLGATSGWDDGLIEVIPRGFTKFGGAFGRVEYTPVENLNVFANGTYRKNRYANEEIDILLNQATEDETYQGRCGVDWKFYRWFTLGLLYTYTNRISPDPENEFVDNRIGLTLTARKPFKW
jgi:hypothetical protein